MIWLVLSYHSPDQWIKERAAKLRALGCSEEFLERFAAQQAAREYVPAGEVPTK